MKIALGLQYNGTDYNGWQKQSNLQTVQETVEFALSNVANQVVSVYCAGRTDAGVHASAQVIHFETTVNRPIEAWISGTNSYLPSDIRIQWAKPVTGEFHARFSATARRYHYLIYNHRVQSALLHDLTTWEYQPLNHKKMQEAAQYLLGEQDFSSFRSSECQSKTPMRNIINLEVKRIEKFVIIDIKANAFLHHMVRNIAGVLIKIGQEKKPVHWAEEVLHACDRTKASITTPPNGLYLVGVDYPDKFAIPKHNEKIICVPE